jgi:hypothetical protein
MATIFLLNKGDTKQSIELLYNLHQLKLSANLWSPSRIYGNESMLSPVYIQNGINITLTTTCHYIELILKLELPLIFSAFRMSGLAPSQICSHWLKQCFWNYLDFNEIVSFISICIIFGIDYQTYFCIAILKHLNMDENNQIIIQHHTSRDLQLYLKENQIENFMLNDHIDYMKQLEIKYRSYILNDIDDTFKEASKNV